MNYCWYMASDDCHMEFDLKKNGSPYEVASLGYSNIFVCQVGNIAKHVPLVLEASWFPCKSGTSMY